MSHDVCGIATPNFYSLARNLGSRRLRMHRAEPFWSGEHVPLETCTLRFWEQGNYEYFMMDWTRLVTNLLKIITKRLPRDCVLQGYMSASLTFRSSSGSGRPVSSVADSRRPGKGDDLLFCIILRYIMLYHIVLYSIIYDLISRERGMHRGSPSSHTGHL